MEFAWICLIVALSWGLGGIVGGTAGIGAVMVAMPLLTLVLPSSEAVLVSCLVGVYGTIHLSLSYRKSCRWKEIRDLGIGSIPGCIVGGLVLKVAPMQVLQLMVCAILACFILMQCFRRFATYRLPESSWIGLLAGFSCGFVSGSVAMAGAPLGIYVLMKHWEPDRARGNMSVFYLFTSFGAVAVQAAAGLYTPPVLQMALAGSAGCALGTALGVKLGRRINLNLFRKLVLLFLAASTVILFVRSVG